MYLLSVVNLSVILISLVSVTNTAKILAYYPTPSISHHVVFRPLTNELAKRGHIVTVVTADPQYYKDQCPDNIIEVDVHDLSYEIWRDYFVKKPAGKSKNLEDAITIMFEAFVVMLEGQFHSEEVQNVLNHVNNYDLLIVEAYTRPLLVLSHIFKIPIIHFSSLGLIFDSNKFVGIPQNELLYPTVLRQKVHNLTIFDQFIELYSCLNVKYVSYINEDKENSMLKRVFGKDVPLISELANNIDLTIVNAHPMFWGIRPMPQNAIFVYGIHSKPKEELPSELKNYLDSSENGVIYISFGTNVLPSLLPPERIEIMKKVVSMLPYNVLWKWDKNEMSDKPENVKIAKWFPQSDLLRHPKVKLFVTQGGLQSTDEAIEAGVPLLGIPLFGDQWFNVEQYVFLKIGLRVDFENISEQSFKHAVSRIIEDRSFHQNIVNLKSFLGDQPQKSLERAVWWTEYVMRHGGAKHLHPPTANKPWDQLLELELTCILLIGLVVSIAIARKAILYLLKLLGI